MSILDRVTPGEWSAEADHQASTIGIYSRSKRFGTQLIAEAFSEDMGDDLPDAANAHLLAASKRLYAALDELRNHVDHHVECTHWDGSACNCGAEEALTTAREALAAAEGTGA